MNDARSLIERMDDFLLRNRIPVRLSLNAHSGYEVSIQSLSTASSERRKGHASSVMKELIQQADDLGVDLDLEALPSDEDGADAPDIHALVSFYETFGFCGEVDEDEGSAMMSRPSPQPPRPAS